jgi:predicted phage-related endonuclease
MDIEELAAIAVAEGLPLEQVQSLMERLTPHYGLRPDGIVDLASLGLTPKQRQQRNRSIGGSDARIIAKGDPAKLRELAEIIRGDRVHADISGELTVRCGHWFERLNLALFEERAAELGYCQFGTRITRHGEVVRHPTVPHRHASLDGFLVGEAGFSESAIVECKAAVGFQKVPDLIEKFYPQVQHNMDCCGVDLGYLSMTLGTYHYALQPIEFDPVYMAALAEEEAKFWEMVEHGVVNISTKMPDVVLDLSKMIEIDMTGNNAWSDAATRWLDHYEAAELLERAKVDIKTAIPDDARRAYGHGVQASRAKNGRVTIKKYEDPGATKEAAE